MEGEREERDLLGWMKLGLKERTDWRDAPIGTPETGMLPKNSFRQLLDRSATNVVTFQILLRPTPKRQTKGHFFGLSRRTVEHSENIASSILDV
jgi:hypothetical protein